MTEKNKEEAYRQLCKSIKWKLCFAIKHMTVLDNVIKYMD